MTETLIAVLVLLLLVFAYRQKLVKFRTGGASRLFKMMDRVNASPDAVLGKRDGEKVLRLIQNCDTCEDHKACDIYLSSHGNDCPTFCPNRSELETDHSHTQKHE